MILRAVGVHKVYGAVEAIQHLDVEVATGEFLCILGPTGCGKSTFLNLVAGFEAPTQGEVLLSGKPIERPGPEREMVFQEHGLYPWLTVEGNVEFGPRIRGGGRQERRQLARNFLDLVGLTGFECHYPDQLSGGMKQRAALARTLINEPQVLLMDEPFGALDAITRTQMQQLLLSIWSKTQATVIFVTHDVDEAILLGDRVLVMTPRPGRVAAEFEISLPRPRAYEVTTTDAFVAIKRQLLQVLKNVVPEVSANGR